MLHYMKNIENKLFYQLAVTRYEIKMYFLSPLWV